MSTASTPTLEALEQLLRNDAAVREAGRAAAAAETARTVDNIQLSNALQRLRASGAIRPQAPIPAAPGLSAATPGTPTFTPANVPQSAPSIQGGGVGASVGVALGLYNALPAIQGAAENIAISAGNIGSILSGNPSAVREQRQLSNPFALPFVPTAFGDEAQRRQQARIQRSQEFIGDLFDPIACALFNRNCPGFTPEGIPYAGDSYADPPFYGGQTPGVQYNVHIDSTFSWSTPRSYDKVVTGPISFIGYRIVSNGGTWQIYIDDAAATDVAIAGGSYPAGGVITVTATVTRLDGQPDTGGNPAPLPGTQPRLRAPIVGNPLGNPRLPQPNTRETATPTTTPALTPPNPALQPVAPIAPPIPGDPTAPPATPERPNDNDPFNPISRLPWWLPLLGIRPANPTGTSSRVNRQSNPQRTNDPGRGSRSGEPPSLDCQYDRKNINATVLAMQTFMEGQMMGKLNEINTKLGVQVPGGISGVLGQVFTLGKRTWNFLQIDRVLHVLTWIGVLHNAYMLSNNLAQTLFEGIGNVLNVFGIQDEDGNSLDVGQMVSNWTNSFFVSFLGQETVTGIKEGWKLANRIYQSAANIVFSLQSITYSMVEMLEVISNYVGRIGNALKRSGTILANSFSWMNPSVNYTNNRFFNTLENSEEFVENISRVASEVLNIQEVGAQLFDQKEEFETALDEGVEFVTQQESVNKGASTRPNLVITSQDEIRAEVE